ncbi:hypothetical protein N9454_06950, partial [Flavobacteriaceae bacterium]|nr:hypothetical protein [Flavobacteriaceae bacterium]
VMDSLNKFLKNITGFQYYFILTVLFQISVWVKPLPFKLVIVFFSILSFFRLKKLNFTKNKIIVFFTVNALLFLYPENIFIAQENEIIKIIFALATGLYLIFISFQLIFKNFILIKNKEIIFNIVLFLFAFLIVWFVLIKIGLEFETNNFKVQMATLFISTYIVYFIRTLIYKTSLYKRFFSKEKTNDTESSSICTECGVKKKWDDQLVCIGCGYKFPKKEDYTSSSICTECGVKKKWDDQLVCIGCGYKFPKKEDYEKKSFNNENHSKYIPKTNNKNADLDNNEVKAHSKNINDEPNEDKIPERINFNDFKSVGFVNFYNGLPYTGTGFELNKEGNIKTEFNLVNGIKEGKAIEFYDNGSVKIETFYTNNKVNGLSTTFFKNGKVKSKASFDNGKLADVKSDIELNKETKSNSKISKEDAKNKLLELKEYLDLGIITQDEFDEKAKPLKKILLGN